MDEITYCERLAMNTDALSVLVRELIPVPKPGSARLDAGRFGKDAVVIKQHRGDKGKRFARDIFEVLPLRFAPDQVLNGIDDIIELIGAVTDPHQVSDGVDSGFPAVFTDYVACSVKLVLFHFRVSELG